MKPISVTLSLDPSSDATSLHFIPLEGTLVTAMNVGNGDLTWMTFETAQQAYAALDLMRENVIKSFGPRPDPAS